jgi:hypothetical protein
MHYEHRETEGTVKKCCKLWENVNSRNVKAGLYCITDRYDRRGNHFLLKSVNTVPNQRPVKIYVLLLSAQLTIEEIYPLITTSPPNAAEANCGLLHFLLHKCK